MSRATDLAAPLIAALAFAAGAQGAQAQDFGAQDYGAQDFGTRGAVADRYGAGPSPSPSAGSAPAAQLRGRMLDWPGKQAAMPPAAPVVSAYAPPQPYVGRGYASAAYARPYAPPASARTWASSQAASPGYPRSAPPSRYAAYAKAPAGAPASEDGWRPVFAAAPAPRIAETQPALAGPPVPAALPTSIYTPAPQTASAYLSPAARAAALPPPRGSAGQRYGYDDGQDHSVHFYSVHRPFGIQPDPAPIPPQFFTATADLAAPPGPLPTERTTKTSSGSTTETVRAAPDTGTD